MESFRNFSKCKFDKSRLHLVRLAELLDSVGRHIVVLSTSAEISRVQMNPVPASDSVHFSLWQVVFLVVRFFFFSVSFSALLFHVAVGFSRCIWNQLDSSKSSGGGEEAEEEEERGPGERRVLGPVRKPNYSLVKTRLKCGEGSGVFLAIPGHRRC